MVQWLNYINILVFALFFFCYAYQFVYVGVRFFKKNPVRTAQKMHKYAAIIAARNESQVIGELIRSLQMQNYSKDLLEIFVIADNCTDNTAQVARRAGAIVFERNNLQQVGKSYALNHAFQKIEELYGICHYDGYFVFDADNVLDANYVREMNKVFDNGYPVVTSYRNSKNYGYNWISAGYALWFLRESKYLNGARMLCHTSCAISGTGFLVSSEIIRQDGGWKYNLMTEDIEFTVDKVIGGNSIGYCETAVLYDEQPVDFKTSWNQRMRWTKGFYQVMLQYGRRLLRGCRSEKGFQCFDMLATIAPATLLTLVMLLLNAFALTVGLANERDSLVIAALWNIWAAFRNIYVSLFVFGLITIVTEWKQIHCSGVKKILYLFTFPIFMFTYLPIAIVTLFKMKSVTWVPIHHTFVGTMTEIHRATDIPSAKCALSEE
jgi:cellulose synthase/poly-beta-1,6-N-acetylglucosamine synthase-like glycosyltransferase